MKSFIAALVLAFVFSISVNSLAQDQGKTKSNVTTTKTEVTKDGKNKKITKKIVKTTKKECSTKSGCCDDDSKGSCSDKESK